MNSPSAPNQPLPTDLARILDASPVATFVIDLQHRVMLWNRGCAEVLGVPADSVLGTDRQWSPFYPSPRPTMADLIIDGRIDEIADRLYGGKGLSRSAIIPGAFEACDFFPHLGPGGRWLFFTAAPIHNNAGEIIGAVETLQDVSAQKQAEIALQTANQALEVKVAARTAELAEANRQLADGLRRAEELSQLKSDFIAMVSHELMTPLNAINGFSELIGMDPGSEEVGEYAEEINASGKNLLHLLDSMLQMVEIGSGKARIMIFPHASGELFESVIREHAAAAAERGIELSLRQSPKIPGTLKTDGTRLKSCLGALIDNAIRYMDKPGGKVALEADAAAGDLLLRIIDNGPGIPPGQEESIFEQFRQVEDYEQRRHGGLGLGLSLARAQARLLGGELSLEGSTGGQGSCFLLRIPAELPDAD
ncbi:PAS domain-containing sensor histidine kinase [Dechloromonas sp. ZY10]|uniref:PAS domain-containing sensor histidine kinase n=1 Tax=Dechloromonas aquae TaxID=2664436 RepID=UPI003528AB66